MRRRSMTIFRFVILWARQLQALADELGTVGHPPPGISKCNKIAHRLLVLKPYSHRDLARELALLVQP
jgi:hypothetical protein